VLYRIGFINVDSRKDWPISKLSVLGRPVKFGMGLIGLNHCAIQNRI
jgi:hypothetical protein